MHPRIFCFCILMALMSGIAGGRPALAQAVLLRADETLARLRADTGSEHAFFVNGPNAVGLTPNAAAQQHHLGSSAKLVLSLAALRLADKGLLDLDAPVAKALPDLLAFDPFEVAVTARHLMAETAGFARPVQGLSPEGYRAPLEYFLIKSRGAGQIPEDDPVGWHLLARYLEHAAHLPLDRIVADEVLGPLGLGPDAIVMGTPSDHSEPPLANATVSGHALVALAHILMENRAGDGNQYLAGGSFSLLVEASLWQMHPLAPARLAGLVRNGMGTTGWVRTAGCGGVTFANFPHMDTVLVVPDSSCSADRLDLAAQRIAHDAMPPTRDEAALFEVARKLSPPYDFGNFFLCADASAWLMDRIAGPSTCAFNMVVLEGGDLGLQPVAGMGRPDTPTPPRRFREVVPYYYVSPEFADWMILSPYKSGGYAYLGGRFFVRADMLGRLQEKARVWLPLILLGLLSAGLHIRSKTSVQWRRFAAFGFIGGGLVAFGLYADWHWWPTVLYEQQLPWLVTLWRTGLNIGLMLVLAMPMLAMSFLKSGNMPRSGVALLFAGPHLGLISLAAMLLFLVTVVWGVAGTFGPY